MLALGRISWSVSGVYQYIVLQIFSLYTVQNELLRISFTSLAEVLFPVSFPTISSKGVLGMGFLSGGSEYLSEIRLFREGPLTQARSKGGRSGNVSYWGKNGWKAKFTSSYLVLYEGINIFPACWRKGVAFSGWLTRCPNLNLTCFCQGWTIYQVKLSRIWTVKKNDAIMYCEVVRWYLAWDVCYMVLINCIRADKPTSGLYRTSSTARSLDVLGLSIVSKILSNLYRMVVWPTMLNVSGGLSRSI